MTPWGFDPTVPGAPVVVSYGRLDVNVPPGHGDWLAAHVAGARVVVDEAGGHQSQPEVLLECYRSIAAAAS